MKQVIKHSDIWGALKNFIFLGKSYGKITQQDHNKINNKGVTLRIRDCPSSALTGVCAALSGKFLRKLWRKKPRGTLKENWLTFCMWTASHVCRRRLGYLAIRKQIRSIRCSRPLNHTACIPELVCSAVGAYFPWAVISSPKLSPMSLVSFVCCSISIVHLYIRQANFALLFYMLPRVTCTWFKHVGIFAKDFVD